MVNRYNTKPAAAINGGWSPDLSSGQAIEKMEKLVGEKLPYGFQTQWTELTYLQNLAGNTAILIFPLCVLLVFLTHAAEYESFSLPLAIVLIVPMSLLCALVGVWYCGMDNNLFTQIGFVVLAGLACKNAVLIVEFAKQQREHGLSIHDAVVEASRLRLRPIIMTSFAFILGVTFFGLFLTPIFYNVLQHLSEWWSGEKK
jgi:multidrug efflux pump